MKASTAGSVSGSRPSAVVLGGGVVGVTMAYDLNERGYEVTLVEKNAELVIETSRANGGFVSVGCSHPWNSPAAPMTVLRSWGSVGSPFLFRASAFPSVVPWGVRYLLQCRAKSYHEASVASVGLLSYSLHLLREAVSQRQLQYDRLRNGVLKFFQDAGQVRQEAAHAEKLADFGLRYRVVTAEEAVELEPTLHRQRESIEGGLYFPDDESGDACKYTQALARVCADRGVKIQLDTTVTDLATLRGRIDEVVTDRGRVRADQYVLAIYFTSRAACSLTEYPSQASKELWYVIGS